MVYFVNIKVLKYKVEREFINIWAVENGMIVLVESQND